MGCSTNYHKKQTTFVLQETRVNLWDICRASFQEAGLVKLVHPERRETLGFLVQKELQSLTSQLPVSYQSLTRVTDSVSLTWNAEWISSVNFEVCLTPSFLLHQKQLTDCWLHFFTHEVPLKAQREFTCRILPLLNQLLIRLRA